MTAVCERNKPVSNKSREANRLSYTSRAIVCEHYSTVSSSRDIGNDLVFPHLQASYVSVDLKIYLPKPINGYPINHINKTPETSNVEIYEADLARWKSH